MLGTVPVLSLIPSILPSNDEGRHRGITADWRGSSGRRADYRVVGLQGTSQLCHHCTMLLEPWYPKSTFGQRVPVGSFCHRDRVLLLWS